MRIETYGTGKSLMFVAISSYEERLVLKEAGFRWDPQARRWWTRSPLVVAKLRNVAELSAEVAAMVNAAEVASAASRATDAAVELPVPPGLELRPYQRAGVAYALQVKANGYLGCLIADEMGLGKTVQAIVAANAFGSERVLVVCPASVVLNWCREIAVWAINTSVKVLAKTKPYTPTPAAGWNVVNYDKLGLAGFEDLFKTKWDLVIYDESHYVKNHKAQRTKRALSIPAGFRLFLTGTPVLNRPVELWTTVHACAPQVFSSRSYFVQRYCDAHETKWGWDESGASNLGELQAKLRSTIMVRRLKADVLDELPPKTRQVLPLEASGSAVRKAMKIWEQAVDAFGLEHAAERLAGSPVGFEQFAEIRRAVGMAKVPATVQHVTEIVESGTKVIVFAHHHDVVDAVYDGLVAEGIPAVTVTGATVSEARQKAVDEFQTRQDIKVFIGTVGAAGAGITLTAASVVVFAELPLVPGLVEQAEDRAHRIGQRESVLVQYLVHDGTVDAYIAQMLARKAGVIRAATN